MDVNRVIAGLDRQSIALKRLQRKTDARVKPVNGVPAASRRGVPVPGMTSQNLSGSV
jgi:hypothetical protein